MWKKIAAVCLMSVAMNAQATSFFSGNDLVKFMRDYERLGRGDPQANVMNVGNFMGYVVGVADTVNGVLYCTPQNVIQGQVFSVVAQFMNANPARWSEPASNLVLSALVTAFPCKKK